MQVSRCPLCLAKVYQEYKLQKKDRTPDEWLHCRYCGTLFNNNPIDKAYFNEAYRQDYLKIKKVRERFQYYVRQYACMVEERTYGRRFLDVGFCLDYTIKEMAERGWVATGIDLIPNDYITGDFETHDFQGQRFDFIQMADVLQCFEHPAEAVWKAYNLLEPQGILFIVTPDPDLIGHNYIELWGHWDTKENRHFINRSTLHKILQRCDRELSGEMITLFEEQNRSNRFMSWETIHWIGQKRKIEAVKDTHNMDT